MDRFINDFSRFPSRFLKCSFNFWSLSSWLVAFTFVLKLFFLQFTSFTITFNSILWGEVKQILQAYGLSISLCYHYNDFLQKHESNGLFTWWRHQLLWHCCWSPVRSYISTIFVYTQLRLHTLNVSRSNRIK